MAQSLATLVSRISIWPNRFRKSSYHVQNLSVPRLSIVNRSICVNSSILPLSKPMTAFIDPKYARYFSSFVKSSRQTNGDYVDYGATSSLNSIISQKQAENFAAYAHINRHQKVKPFIIKRRIKQLRSYVGAEKNIRHSPWRMNLVCQFAAGLTVPEAMKQLMFCQKVKAPLVFKLIEKTAKEADKRDGLQPSQLEVAECFATHGTHLKRIKIMGRGRSGKMHRRHSHVRLVLREIDFPLKLVQAESLNQKRRWLGLLNVAREDYERAKVERDELAELEAKAAQLEAEAKKKEESK